LASPNLKTWLLERNFRTLRPSHELRVCWRHRSDRLLLHF